MGERVGGYRLERLLGRGGDGEVWCARADGPVPRVVALKRLGPRAGPHAAAALRTEAALLADLDHPGLVRVLDVVDDPPGVALVLPYLPAGSVRHLLDHRGALDAGEVVALLRPVAEAVASLHRRGWVHGDLKPENLLLTSDGHPLVADVGVARAVGAPGDGLEVAGTPAYLDPAVAGGGAPGPRADLYALGVVAYEALTGRQPHRGSPAEVVALAAAAVHRPLTSWPSVPGAVAAEVERALDPDPDGRRVGPVAFVEALEAAVDGADVRLPPLAPSPPLPSTDPGARDATVRFGVAPVPVPTADRTRAGRLARARRAALVGALVAVGLVAAGLVGAAGPHRSGPSARPAASGPGRDAPDWDGPGPGSPGGGRRPDGGDPCRAPRPVGGPGRVRRADVDGDGCADLLRWDGSVLRVGAAGEVRAYRVGSPGDQLLLGDWDGDGADTPALYRVARGAVLYVDRFPPGVGEELVASRVEPVVVGGTATVVRRSGEPDEVAVRGGR